MNKTTISAIVIAASFFFTVACNSTKKTAATTSIIPAQEQLKAIQAKYPDVTMQTLTEGHGIYIGACTNCHGQKNIYKRSEENWMKEIDKMSPKAKLTAAQKDALTKYILSMKYTQPVEVK